MRIVPVLTALAMMMGIGCATKPSTASGQRNLEARAQATLRDMRARDPGLDNVIAGSTGYVVFPEIGKGGVVVGAAYGRGVLFEGGQPTGFVELNQGSIGAQLGGQTFSELLVFRDRAALDRLKRGVFQFGANASAVALTTGASANAEFVDGVAVFTLPRGGMMAELTVSGQQFNFEPRG
jgi:lipid-binding SYLF domain-containing protein